MWAVTRTSFTLLAIIYFLALISSTKCQSDTYLSSVKSINDIWISRNTALNHTITKLGLGDFAKGFLDYNYTLPPVLVKRGIQYMGGQSRLKKIFSELFTKSRTAVNIGVIGGSISCGQGTFAGETFLDIFTGWMVRYIFICRLEYEEK